MKPGHNGDGRSLINVLDGGATQKLSSLSNTNKVLASAVGAGIRLELLSSNGKEKSAERSAIEPLLRLQTRGQMRITAKQGKKKLNVALDRGSLAIFSSGLTLHDIEWEARDSSFILLSLDPHSMDKCDAIAEKILTQLDAHIGFSDPVLKSLLEAVNHRLHGPHPPDPLFMDSVGLSITAHLAAQYCRGGSAMPARPSREARMQRAVEYMETCFGSKVTLADLASAAGLSAYHFSHSFKRTYGVSPLRMLADIRLEAARRLLAADHHSIAEIALLCGFSSQSHFTKAYVGANGVTPARQRRSLNGG